MGERGDEDGDEQGDDDGELDVVREDGGPQATVDGVGQRCDADEHERQHQRRVGHLPDRSRDSPHLGGKEGEHIEDDDEEREEVHGAAVPLPDELAQGVTVRRKFAHARPDNGEGHDGRGLPDGRTR